MSATQIEINGPAPTTAYGVLNCFVQQPVANSPALDPNGKSTYTEKWKGPYIRGKEILASISVGDTRGAFYLFLGANKIQRISPPAAWYTTTNDQGIKEQKLGIWRILSVSVEELPAGDHCIITVNYEAVEDDSQVNDLKEDEYSNTWRISWQSYSVTPYEFANGTVHGDLPVSPVGQFIPDWTVPASRSMIETYKSHNPQTLTVGGDVVCFYTPNPKTPDHRLALGQAEVELLKKVNSNRCATYHYPIVTHHTAFSGTIDKNFNNDLGGSLDVVTSLPTECPYSFAPIKTNGGEGEWKWLKIGDDITQTKSPVGVRYERNEIWAGYTDVDLNYYGSTPFTHDKEGIKNGRWYKNCL